MDKGLPHPRFDDSKEKEGSEEKGEDAGCDGDQNVSSKRVQPTGKEKLSELWAASGNEIER
jgi:hypothetical protein